MAQQDSYRTQITEKDAKAVPGSSWNVPDETGSLKIRHDEDPLWRAPDTVTPAAPEQANTGMASAPAVKESAAREDRGKTETGFVSTDGDTFVPASQVTGDDFSLEQAVQAIDTGKDLSGETQARASAIQEQSRGRLDGNPPAGKPAVPPGAFEPAVTLPDQAARPELPERPDRPERPDGPQDQTRGDQNNRPEQSLVVEHDIAHDAPSKAGSTDRTDPVERIDRNDREDHTIQPGVGSDARGDHNGQLGLPQQSLPQQNQGEQYQGKPRFDQGGHGNGGMPQADRQHRLDWYTQLNESQKAQYRQFGTVAGVEGMPPVQQQPAAVDATGRSHYAPGAAQTGVNLPPPFGGAPTTRIPVADASPVMGAGGQPLENKLGMQVIDPVTGKWNGQYVDRAGNTYHPLENNTTGQMVYVDQFGNQYMPVEDGVPAGAAADGFGFDANTNGPMQAMPQFDPDGAAGYGGQQDSGASGMPRWQV